MKGQVLVGRAFGFYLVYLGVNTSASLSHRINLSISTSWRIHQDPAFQVSGWNQEFQETRNSD